MKFASDAMNCWTLHREYEKLVHLSHTQVQNIPLIRSTSIPFQMQGGVCYFTESFIQNGFATKEFLRYVLNSSRIPIEQKFQIILDQYRKLMQTLREIHDAGIIHGDISEENLLTAKNV